MDYYHQLKKSLPNCHVYIPFIKKGPELLAELGSVQSEIIFSNDKFIVATKAAQRPAWAQDVWTDLHMFPLEQKSQAVQTLKSLPVLGTYYASTLSKRAESIRKELRELKIKRLQYKPFSDFNFKYFVWTILNDECVIYSTHPTSQYPLGWHEFDEDKETPPNRAYLKLWEIFTLGHVNKIPANSVAIELGASPGGWTWVLTEYFKKVYAVDRAALSPKLKNFKTIEMAIGDAFQIDPAQFKDCTWLFSDLICTPERLLELVQHWKKNSNVTNFVCTLKFKGFYDQKIVNKFLEIPDSKIIHLYQNKNELTWIHQGRK